jgi:hypothetical protein
MLAFSNSVPVSFRHGVDERKALEGWRDRLGEMLLAISNWRVRNVMRVSTRLIID